MKALDPLELIRLIYELTNQYIPSPFREILLSAFGAVLLIGLVYGVFFRGFVSSPSQDEIDPDPGTSLREQLKGVKRELRALKTISLPERYYLYFNGIANASLMLGFCVLVDRFWSTSPRDQLPIKQQIGSFISILLVGLSISILLNVLVDVLTESPSRRTDIINRAFLIAFLMNALVFAAYHLNYLNL